MISFGDVFWIPSFKNNPNVAKHWVVLLGGDQKEGLIYYQTLNSRIYKIFPNFGTFKNEHCFYCSKHEQLKDYLRYKKNPYLYLDIDLVTFLDYRKYKFLKKETFLCLRRIEKESMFVFTQQIFNKVYQYNGTLNDCNKRNIIVSARYSKELSENEKICIINSYELDKIA